MNKAELLFKDYGQRLKLLQSRCKHKELTELVNVYWAAGHSSGVQGKFCKVCNKRVKTKKPKFISTTTSTASTLKQTGGGEG